METLQIEQRVMMSSVSGRRHHFGVMMQRRSVVRMVSHHPRRRINIIFRVRQVTHIRPISVVINNNIKALEYQTIKKNQPLAKRIFIFCFFFQKLTDRKRPCRRYRWRRRPRLDEPTTNGHRLHLRVPIWSSSRIDCRFF